MKKIKEVGGWIVKDVGESGPPKEQTFEMGSQYQKKPAGGALG